MSEPLMPLIRPAEPGDLDALYEVCLRTGDAGGDATRMFENPRLLGEVYVGPYLMMPSGIGFTAVDGAIPAGYTLAAVDTRRFEAECEAEWWPALRARYPQPVAGSLTVDGGIIALIHHPHRASDDVVDHYPAHLHLDLLPRLQGKGVGRMMMDKLLDELVARGVPGVHMDVGVGNHRAIGFYAHLGFATLAQESDVVVMGIRLER